MPNYNGGGTNYLLQRRFNLKDKGRDNVNEWKKILEFTFDETEKLPSDIDVSNYTEFFVSLENVTNKGTVQSNLNLSFGQVKVMMITQRKDIKTMCQQVYLRNNGLFLEQYVHPVCMNNNGLYDTQNATMLAPYTIRLNPVLSPLTFSTNGAAYAIITGKIVIYAR